ncbi:MAG TPA: ABC transporter permease subunit [Clostridia bacterium]|nr:ABC transporter permease subunit [Clostridia bacterium]
MILFLRELKRNRKYFIIWTSIMTALMLYMGLLFPTMADQTKNMTEMIKQMPEILRNMMNLDLMDFTNVVKYYASEPYVFLLLLGGVFSMILAAGILSKEESDKTIEFLYAKPVTRNYIVTYKLLSTLLYIILFNVILGVVTIAIFEAVKKHDFSISLMVTLMMGALLLQLVFAAVGFVASVFVVKAKSILPLSIGVVIGTYILNTIAGLSDKTDWLKYLTPFKYVDAVDIVKTGRINGGYLVIMTVVIVVSIILSYVFYNRKNITV